MGAQPRCETLARRAHKCWFVGQIEVTELAPRFRVGERARAKGTASASEAKCSIPARAPCRAAQSALFANAARSMLRLQRKPSGERVTSRSEHPVACDSRTKALVRSVPLLITKYSRKRLAPRSPSGSRDRPHAAGSRRAPSLAATRALPARSDPRAIAVRSAASHRRSAHSRQGSDASIGAWLYVPTRAPHPLVLSLTVS
jgi:hypothetical protein